MERELTLSEIPSVCGTFLPSFMSAFTQTIVPDSNRNKFDDADPVKIKLRSLSKFNSDKCLKVAAKKSDLLPPGNI